MRRMAERTLRQLVADERGAIAVMFAMLLLPMIGLTFTAIDYGRAIHLESRLQTAVDSAASAAVHKLGLDRETIEAAARQHLDRQLPDSHKGMPFALVVAPENRAVEISVETTIGTSLIGLLGVDRFTVRAASQAYPSRPAKAKSIEAALPPGTDPEIARALAELARRGGGGGPGPTAEQQEEIRRATEAADSMIRDALSRLGR